MARFRTGQLTISAAAQQIHPPDSNEFSQYIFKARSGNAGDVALGDSSVTAGTGFLLEPGDERLYDYNIGTNHPTADVSLESWWAVGTPGDKLTWLAFLH